MERRAVYYSGRVQGVGFRYTANAVARGYEVTGFVRNLPDGRVEIIVEGLAPELDRFLAELADKLSQYIETINVQVQPPTGEFTQFAVQR